MYEHMDIKLALFLELIIAKCRFLNRASCDDYMHRSSHAYKGSTGLKGGKGKVIMQEDEVPLTGVSITIKGASGGTIADAKGGFSLDIPSDDALVFSCLGHTAKEMRGIKE
jgi:hypothetical protein